MEPKARHVEEGLIDRDPLDEWGNRAHDLEDLARDLAVAAMVRAHHGERGASPSRLADRHRRSDSETSGLVARRRNHAALAGATNGDGNSDEVRVVETLDLDEERIHVNVKNRFGERCHGTTVPGSLQHMITGPRTISLVRHGEVLNPEHIVYADLPGFPLSSLGRQQAAKSAERLPDHATVVTSPLDRAVETATIIAEQRNGRLIVDDSLTEWGLATRWAGHPWDALDDVFPGELTAYLEHPVHLPFSPESLASLANRMAGAVSKYRALTDGPLVVVSHQDPIQAARLSLTGRRLADLNRDKPQHASVIELEACPTGSWIECAMWAPDQRTTDVQPAPP